MKNRVLSILLSISVIASMLSATILTVSAAQYSLYWPVPTSAAAIGKYSSAFGPRTSPTAGASSNHRGIDIPVAKGTAVYAAYDGEVVAVGKTNARGNYVLLYHSSIGLSTLYQHLTCATVQKGSTVKGGTQVAVSGNTGVGTGAHLHFGVMVGKATKVDNDQPSWNMAINPLGSNISYTSSSGKIISSNNPDDYTYPTRDLFYTSPVKTGNDVKWVQAVLFKLGYTIGIDGSFGPATRDVVKQFQSDNGLSVDGSVGPATRAKLLEKWNSLKNGNISITLHTWLSDTEFGDTPEKFVARNRVYLCYELISTNTGEKINSLVNKSYSTVLTLYRPDGSVFYTNEVKGDDNSWISVVPYEAGVYKGKVSVSGDINLSLNVSFTLVYDAVLKSSSSSISLNLNSTNSKLSTFTVSGGYPGEYGIRYSVGDTAIISASWGDWNGNSIPITVTGKKIGKTDLTISLYENYTSNKNVVESIIIPVTVGADTYTVTFNSNGGSVSPTSKNVTYSETYGSLPTPTKPGYTFDGWYTSSSGGSQVTSTTKVTNASNHTLYAKWTKDTYNLTYNPNGGTAGTDTHMGETVYTIKSEIPTRFGYTFLGWSKSSGATSATYVAGDTITLTSNTTLYAVWKQTTISSASSNTAQITFGGQMYYYKFTPSKSGNYVIYSTGSEDTKVYLYNSSGTELANNDDSGEEKNFRLEYELSSGTTYYYGLKYYNSSKTGSIALKLGGVYSVDYNANGGTGAPLSQAKDYATDIKLRIEQPTRSGYTFLGWSTSSSATSATYQPGSTFSSNASTTLYAVWKKDRELSSISIATNPIKTTYYIRDYLDITGMEIQLIYSDGSTETITNDFLSSGFTTSGFDSSTTGTKTVTVSYKGFTDTFTVAVNTPSVVLSSSNKTLSVGDTATLIATTTPGGYSVTWTSSDTSVATVSNGFISPNKVGTTVITACITYSGIKYSTSCTVTVVDSILVGDINADGVIDAGDAVLISRYDAGFITLTAEQLKAGDVNKDGVVDAGDAVIISRYDAGLIDRI